MQMAQRTLLEGDLLQARHIAVRPSSAQCGEVERQDSNVLVLPLAGVFARHDGPRRHAIATPNHAVLLAAGSPYRISYPGGLGDRCLTLCFSDGALAQMMPHAVGDNGFDSCAFATLALLPPALMLSRSRLWRALARGEPDPLETEERAITLLALVLEAARKKPHQTRSGESRRSAQRRLRQVECVKEAISLRPGHKWTLGELAGLAHVSVHHLAHVFREETGTPVYRYVLRARLADALEAVLDAGTGLTAIALEAGFASHSHFTNRFRVLFGATPIELRRGARGRDVAQLRKIVTAKPPASA